MRLIESCPTCTKPLIELSRTDILGETYRSYKCGHSFADTAIVSSLSALEGLMTIGLSREQAATSAAAWNVIIYLTNQILAMEAKKQ